MTAIDSFVASLRSHNYDPRQSGRGWKARCPAHDDKKPSLSVNAGNDGCVLLNCHAGCDAPTVVEALGLQMVDLFADSPNGSPNGHAKKARQIVAEYDYRDEGGKLLFQAVRFHPKDFRQRRPDGVGGWEWKLGDVRRVLYRLPELLRAPLGSVIYIVEGEKDADRLGDLGLFATCNPMGAGKWSKVEDEPLRDRPVVVLADNDTPGRRHAQDVAAQLTGKARSVRIVELPDLPDGGDVSDWLDAEGDPDDLDRLSEQAAVWSPPTDIERTTPPLTAGESLAAVRRMARRSKELRTGMFTLADEVAEWFDRRGHETLAMEYPVAYAAKAVGVSRQHFYRLRDNGRIRRLLVGCHPAGDTSDDLPERVLRPLTRLLDGRPGEVAVAYTDAMSIAQGGPLTSRHTTAAVEELVPAAKRVRPVSPSGDTPRGDAITPEELAMQVSALLDIAVTVCDAPEPLLTLLGEAHRVARQWVDDLGTHS